MSASSSIVNRLTAGQWGMLTTAQANAAGVSRKRLSELTVDGVLERVGQGIYAVPAAADDELVEVRTAWLAMDPATMAYERLQDPATAGVISHASAAELHRLGYILPLAVEITYPMRHQTRRAGVRIHRAPLTADDVTTVDGLPVTNAARTIVDLIGDGHDLEHVAQVAAAALDQGKTTTQSLAGRLEPYARRLGARSGQATSGAEAVDHLLSQVHRDLQSTVDQVATHPLVQQAAARNILQSTGGAALANWQKSLADSAIARIGEQIKNGAAAQAGAQIRNGAAAQAGAQMRQIAMGRAGKALAEQHAQQLKALQMPGFKKLLNAALGDAVRGNNAIIAAAFKDTIMPKIDIGAITSTLGPPPLQSSSAVLRTLAQTDNDHGSDDHPADPAGPSAGKSSGGRAQGSSEVSRLADEVGVELTDDAPVQGGDDVG